MSLKSDVQGFDISGACAAMIGCGGLGCHIATHLACAGIGSLIICDFDTVSESNLNRQFLYGHDDIGHAKTSLMKARLEALSPSTRVTEISRKIEKNEDLDFCDGADIVFLACDNNKARALVQECCRAKELPLVNGGVNGFFGTAYLYVPGLTPDLEAAGMLSTENPRILAVSSTVGVIGALEAHLGVKYLLGDKSAAGRLHVFDDGQISVLPIRAG